MSQLISVKVDEGTIVQGYIAIDTTVNGYCHGGVRMATDLAPDTIANVARMMTLKYGFIGLPMGGAKAGVVADPEMPQEEKQRVLAQFARAIRPFLKTRSFIPSGDIGTNEDDISSMMKSVGLGHKRRAVARELSGFYTGITVFTSAVAAARHTGLDLSRASVAIEGFGNVGMPAARAFWQNGIKVKAISTSQGAIYDDNGLDIDALIKLQHETGSQVIEAYKGAQRIDKSRLLELDVDIFLPCAQPFSIDEHNAGCISAGIISPGANAPATDKAEGILFERNKLLLPDFVSNCGGVFGSSMKLANLTEGHIMQLLKQKIDEQTSWILESAEKENVSSCSFARQVAMQRFGLVKAAAENRKLTSRLLNYALKVYRNGIVPPLLTAPLAGWYFKRKFSS